MAKVLTTKGLAAELEDLIRSAKSDVYLISYSFRIDSIFLKRIKQAVEKGVRVHVVFGKFIYENTRRSLASIPGLKVYYCQDLHAKIYANSEKCIIGSMNFSEASEQKNTELGVLLNFKEDEGAFKEGLRHCEEIVAEATPWHEQVSSIPNYEAMPMGFCIRTGAKIPLNHERPYSIEGYNAWSEVNDPGFREPYDHFTGEATNGRTSKTYPVLSRNWENYLRALYQEKPQVVQK